MDERVRREEDSQAKQTRQVNETGKVERRPTPPRSSKTDRRSRWPFSWKDFAKTDEFRLPTISPELAAFFRSPVRALPGRQITDPSSLPRISERNDNGQSQSEPSQSTAQSSMEPHEVGVGQLTNPTGTRTREEREASYAMPSTSKPHGKQREVSLQPQTPPKATTPASLERMREDESARRHQSLPITPQPKANTQGSEEEAQSISVENTVATGGKIAGGAPETEDMHLVKIVEMLRSQGNFPYRETDYPIRREPLADTHVTFEIKPRAYVSGEYTGNSRRHGALLILEIVMEFGETTHVSSYTVQTSFDYSPSLKSSGLRVLGAVCAVDKGDAEMGRVERMASGSRHGIGISHFQLENCESKAIVIHMAFLLGQAGGEITEPFRARVEASLNVELRDPVRKGIFFSARGLEESRGDRGVPSSPMEMTRPIREVKNLDTEVPVEPKDLEGHRKRLVLDGFNLRELLQVWVKLK